MGAGIKYISLECLLRVGMVLPSTKGYKQADSKEKKDVFVW